MQVIGFNFEKISAEKKLPKPKDKTINVNSNINIKNISPDQLEVIKDKSVLKFDFEFEVDYKPEFANILFKGNVLTLTEKEEAKNVLKKWKSKKIPEEIRLPLFNLILTKCNLRALQLEEELNLPTHVPLPKIKQEPENKSYTG